jgi:hypothetical protein
MEPLLETIDLDIEESNELLFKVKVEGVEQAPAKVRLVCEAGDVSYMFNGTPTQDEGVIQFILPVLKDKLKAGTYLSRVEVLIENRYFAPVQFNVNLKQAVTVVAESLQTPQRRQVPQVSVTASAPIVVKKAAPAVVLAPKRAVEKPAGTLKERFAQRAPVIQDQVVEELDESSEELLKELARGFVGKKR